jgi:hypothetical protein
LACAVIVDIFHFVFANVLPTEEVCSVWKADEKEGPERGRRMRCDERRHQN